MQVFFSDDASDAMFSVTCGNREVFATEIYVCFCENKPLGDDDRDFLARRAQQVLGAWPVVRLDYDTVSAESGGRFTGCRVMVRCAAFDPENPESIEYALMIFHQRSARIQVRRAHRRRRNRR